MSKYKSDYPDKSKLSDNITPMGHTSRQLMELQDAEQRTVAENPEWLLARRLNSIGGKSDSRQELEALGFKVLGEADDLFYKVNPPEGWGKETQGYWTTVRDNDGRERMSQFYKGAFYDRDAFLNINHYSE